MEYIQVFFHNADNDDYTNDILAEYLCEIGFDSFENINMGLVAYCPNSIFNESLMIDTIKEIPFIDYKKLSYSIKKMEDKNWNAIWESDSFKPIIVDNKCIIHSSNYSYQTEYQYDIIINPTQSFGTGYHETTRMMLSFILYSDIRNKNILDFGCGTGVLGILSCKREAKSAIGIDIDNWSVECAKNNCKLNNVDNFEILLGDSMLLNNLNKQFDIIFANINRNIILSDMERYVKVLKNGGDIYFSGFYSTDLDVIISAANKNNLELEEKKEDNNWIAVKFKKKVI